MNTSPTYMDVYTDLRKKIESGELKPRQMLPSTRELAQQYDVSLSTLKMAVVVLKHDGLVDGHQGKGLYATDDWVNVEKVGQRLLELSMSLAAAEITYDWVNEIEAPDVEQGDEWPTIRVIYNDNEFVEMSAYNHRWKYDIYWCDPRKPVEGRTVRLGELDDPDLVAAVVKAAISKREAQAR